MDKALTCCFCYILIAVFWAGMPVTAYAQSAKEIKPDSSFERQRQVSASPSAKGSIETPFVQPPNSFIQYGDIWGCNDGYDKLKNACVSIFSKFGGPPEHSYVQYGTIWGCKRGFSRESNKCISIFDIRRVGSRAKTQNSSFSSSRPGS